MEKTENSIKNLEIKKEQLFSDKILGSMNDSKEDKVSLGKIFTVDDLKQIDVSDLLIDKIHPEILTERVGIHAPINM